MTRYAGRNAILPPLNGFAAQFATAVGGLVFIEFVFSYPGAGFTLQQAALGSDYPLTQGAAARVRRLRDRRQLRHGHPQPRPRPARAGELGGTRVADPAGRGRGGRAERQRPARRARRRSARGAGCPACRCGCASCSRNPKSRIGLIVLAGMVARRGLRAADRDARPDGLLAARREAVALVEPPLRHHGPGHRRLLAGRARGRAPRCFLGAARRGARDGPGRERSASSPPTAAAGSTTSSTSRRTSSS